jgi:hypothetical protein
MNMTHHPKDNIIVCGIDDYSIIISYHLKFQNERKNKKKEANFKEIVRLRTDFSETDGYQVRPFFFLYIYSPV